MTEAPPDHLRVVHLRAGSWRESRCQRQARGRFATILRLLVHAGAVDVAQATSAVQLFDEVRAMTWRLLHPKP